MTDDPMMASLIMNTRKTIKDNNKTNKIEDPWKQQKQRFLHWLDIELEKYRLEYETDKMFFEKTKTVFINHLPTEQLYQ